MQCAQYFGKKQWLIQAVRLLYTSSIIIISIYFQVIQHLVPFLFYVCENSPQALFMKATDNPVDLVFEPATSTSLVDRNKAIILCGKLALYLVYCIMQLQ